jgi:hypothetical protein
MKTNLLTRLSGRYDLSLLFIIKSNADTAVVGGGAMLASDLIQSNFISVTEKSLAIDSTGKDHMELSTVVYSFPPSRHITCTFCNCPSLKKSE